MTSFKKNVSWLKITAQFKMSRTTNNMNYIKGCNYNSKFNTSLLVYKDQPV